MRVRNVAILSLGQAVGVAGIATYVLLGGIVGAELAPSPVWATLPIALTVVGAALAAVPAALLMKRIGRRSGFLLGVMGAGVGMLVATGAVAWQSFGLFGAAALLIGASGAFVQQYRFAAVESVDARHAGRAVSFVLLGGIVAAYLGPELARRSKDWLAIGEYAGSFVSLAVLYALMAAVMIFFKNVVPRQVEASGGERPLREIAAQPLYQTAVLAGAVAYAVMSFIMTATPIHLHTGHGYDLKQTAWVIQSHIIAMFLPSLVSGFILERLGVLRVMGTGVVFMVASVLLGMISQELVHFWGALVLLGVGWNFLFVGATVLLGRSYRPVERFKAQGANDLVIFGSQALASLLAGTVLFYGDWDLLNLISLPFLGLALIALLRLRRQRAPGPGHPRPVAHSPGS